MRFRHAFLLALGALLLTAGDRPRGEGSGSAGAAEKVVLLELFTSQG